MASADKAHVLPVRPAGVGISGQEGMQAVMSADFAIAQFRFLTPLLLVHGRYSYKRITRMVLFFFYKNMFFGTTIFVYNAFNSFSGQFIYNGQHCPGLRSPLALHLLARLRRHQCRSRAASEPPRASPCGPRLLHDALQRGLHGAHTSGHRHLRPRR